MSMTLEREALSLATNGFEVFPVTPGSKAPPLVRFTEVASSEPVTVARFWREHPQANIGVRPGGGTLVVDTDSAEAERLVADLDLPETTSVRTTRGRHRYFRGQAPSRSGIRPGLDCKWGRGAYVLGAGSVVDGTKREWIAPPWEIPPQPAPSALLQLLREGVTRNLSGTHPIPQGRRNTSLTAIAGSFVRYGITGEGLRAALHVVNRERCRPPLPEEEVEQIIASASKWDIPPGWVLDPVGFAEDPRLDTKARHVLASLAARADHEGTVRGGKWLEEIVGLSQRSIYRAVAELERHGRVIVERSPKLANLYRLTFTDDIPWIRRQLAIGPPSGKRVTGCHMVEVG